MRQSHCSKSRNLLWKYNYSSTVFFWLLFSWVMLEKVWKSVNYKKYSTPSPFYYSPKISRECVKLLLNDAKIERSVSDKLKRKSSCKKMFLWNETFRRRRGTFRNFRFGFFDRIWFLQRSPNLWPSSVSLFVAHGTNRPLQTSFDKFNFTLAFKLFDSATIEQLSWYSGQCSSLVFYSAVEKWKILILVFSSILRVELRWRHKR